MGANPVLGFYRVKLLCYADKALVNAYFFKLVFQYFCLYTFVRMEFQTGGRTRRPKMDAKMRLIFLIMILSLAMPAVGAESPAPESKEAAKDAKPEAATQKADEEKKENVYKCKYYTATLPEGWKAFLPPTDQQGIVRALFGKESQNPIIALAITPHGGMDLKSVAEIFAEQFKAPKPPVSKNGQYIFTITKNDLPTQVWISAQGALVMMTSITGNLKDGLAFLKNDVDAGEYGGLFPKP